MTKQGGTIIHKTLVVFSERLEMYLLLVEHFGLEYEVGRYGYTGWYEMEEKILNLYNSQCVGFVAAFLLDGIELDFTKIEFAILGYLIVHLNRAVSYKELYEAVWDKEYLYDDMNIMAHVHRIRKKIGDDVKIRCIYKMSMGSDT